MASHSESLYRPGVAGLSLTRVAAYRLTGCWLALCGCWPGCEAPPEIPEIVICPPQRPAPLPARGSFRCGHSSHRWRFGFLNFSAHSSTTSFRTGFVTHFITLNVQRLVFGRVVMGWWIVSIVRRGGMSRISPSHTSLCSLYKLSDRRLCINRV